MRPGCIVVLLVGCANANPDEAALAIDPDSLALAVGESATLQASSARVSLAGLAWESSDAGIAQVVAGGEGTATVTAISAGDTTILVSLGTFRRTVAVEVTEATVDSVAVTADALLPVGLTTQLTALVHFSDGRTVDFSDKVAWQSADESIASVAPGGSVTANALGTTEISATFMGATGKAS